MLGCAVVVRGLLPRSVVTQRSCNWSQADIPGAHMCCVVGARPMRLLPPPFIVGLIHTHHALSSFAHCSSAWLPPYGVLLLPFPSTNDLGIDP